MHGRAGDIENVIRYLIIIFCDGSSPKQIESYLTKGTKSITNLDYKKNVNLLGEFCSDWQNEFIKNVTSEQQASLNSVVSNRNDIAHGDHQDSITYRNIQDYYVDIKEVAKILKTIIKK